MSKLLFFAREQNTKLKADDFFNNSFLPAQLSISQKNVILKLLLHQLWTPFPCYTTFGPNTAGNLRVEPFRREPHLPERYNFEVDERGMHHRFLWPKTKSPAAAQTSLLLGASQVACVRGVRERILLIILPGARRDATILYQRAIKSSVKMICFRGQMPASKRFYVFIL